MLIRDDLELEERRIKILYLTNFYMTSHKVIQRMGDLVRGIICIILLEILLFFVMSK